MFPHCCVGCNTIRSMTNTLTFFLFLWGRFSCLFQFFLKLGSHDVFWFCSRTWCWYDHGGGSISALQWSAGKEQLSSSVTIRSLFTHLIFARTHMYCLLYFVANRKENWDIDMVYEVAFWPLIDILNVFRIKNKILLWNYTHDWFNNINFLWPIYILLLCIYTQVIEAPCS